MSWVLRHSEVAGTDRLVLLVLADHAKEDGTAAWPSVATIAREARAGERTVQYSLRRLEEAGAIRRAGLHRMEGQRHGTYVYDVLMGADSAPLDNPRVQAETPKGANGDDQRVQIVDRRVQPFAPEPSLEPSEVQPSLEPSEESSSGEVSTAQFAQPLNADPPPLVNVEGRNLALDALAKATGLQPGEPAYGGAIVALNGRTATKKGEPTKGINELAWEELREHVREDQLQELRDDTAKWQEMLKAMIEYKASRYRAEMPNVFITPKALRDWWLRLDRLDTIRGHDTLSTADILDIT